MGERLLQETRAVGRAGRHLPRLALLAWLPLWLVVSLMVMDMVLACWAVWAVGGW